MIAEDEAEFQLNMASVYLWQLCLVCVIEEPEGLIEIVKGFDWLLEIYQTISSVLRAASCVLNIKTASYVLIK